MTACIKPELHGRERTGEQWSWTETVCGVKSKTQSRNSCRQITHTHTHTHTHSRRKKNALMKDITCNAQESVWNRASQGERGRGGRYINREEAAWRKIKAVVKQITSMQMLKLYLYPVELHHRSVLSVPHHRSLHHLPESCFLFHQTNKILF